MSQLLVTATLQLLCSDINNLYICLSQLLITATIYEIFYDILLINGLQIIKRRHDK